MRLAIAALGLGMAVLASPLSAQSSRDGFWMSAGFGYGVARLDCGDCTDERVNGTGGFVRIGGSPTARMLVGGGIGRWTRHKTDADVAFSSVAGLLQFYPIVSTGLFLNGGIGFNRAVFDYPLNRLIRHAVGYELGAGYEIPVTRHLSVAPHVLYTKSFGGGTTRFNGINVDQENYPDYIQIGLALAWH